jgi:ADP-heptose:LPS heptosyltransferase
MKCLSAVTDRHEWKKSGCPSFPGLIARLFQSQGIGKRGKAPASENKVQKIFFHLTSLFTAWFPRSGARFLDAVIPPLLGHPLLVKEIFRKNAGIAKRLKQPGKILVIPDIHIGDAVMMQGAVMAFRDFFPEARIDYVVKKSVAGLIEGNPAITHVYPRFTGTDFPGSGDIESVQKLAAENNYDLCFNTSSFFEDSRLFPKRQLILNFMTVAPQLMRNEFGQIGINHFLHQSYLFIEALFRGIGHPGPAKPFQGVPVTLSDEAIERAQAFLSEKNVPEDKPVLFLNPDTASPYTLIPLEYQAQILKKWLKMDCSVLLGASFTQRDMGEKLLGTLSWEEKERVFPTPTTLPIDAYAALIDSADVFLSGDTGPLHIAAARKVSRSGNFKFRNKTFVISVFGATPSRMSGYDSTHPLYPPANQDVLSKTYVSESPCRNITCVNKMLKTCKTARCFEALDVERIAADIQLHLRNTRAKAPLSTSLSLDRHTA